MSKENKKGFICKDIDTGKEYKTHKFEWENYDCPNCYTDHKICIRCFERKD